MREELCGDLSDYLKIHPSQLLPLAAPNLVWLRERFISCWGATLLWWWAVPRDGNNRRAFDFHLSWHLHPWLLQLKNFPHRVRLSPVIMRSAVVLPTASTTSWVWPGIWASSRVWSNASASPETWTHLREDWMLCCKLPSARCVYTDDGEVRLTRAGAGTKHVSVIYHDSLFAIFLIDFLLSESICLFIYFISNCQQT